MRYQPLGSSDDASKKVKKCVYCNFSIGVGKAIVQKIRGV